MNLIDQMSNFRGEVGMAQMPQEIPGFLNVNNITLHWVKGHAGHDGNMRADAAAVKGAQESALMVNDPPALPKATIHLESRLMVYSIWRKEWDNLPPNFARQTKNSIHSFICM